MLSWKCLPKVAVKIFNRGGVDFYELVPVLLPWPGRRPVRQAVSQSRRAVIYRVKYNLIANCSKHQSASAEGGFWWTLMGCVITEESEQSGGGRGLFVPLWRIVAVGDSLLCKGNCILAKNSADQLIWTYYSQSIINFDFENLPTAFQNKQNRNIWHAEVPSAARAFYKCLRPL